MAKTCIDPAIADAMIRVTEVAAIAAYELAGRGDENKADQAAVDAMRTALNAIPMKGRIVIGEGERDDAPMLYIGEEVGTGTGPEIDLALDPLEGTTLTAKHMPNAMAVLAISPRGGMLHSPDVYMDKIAIGPGFPSGCISLDQTPAENIRELAKARGVDPSRITACILDRPRHQNIIESLRSAGARIMMIPDGDVSAVIYTTDASTGVDIYLGQGGAPEGVLAASALKCIGGQMEGRLFFRNDDEKQRAARTGIKDLNRLYKLEELVSMDTVFCATGVSKGDLLNGVSYSGNHVETETLIMTSFDQATRKVRTRRPL